MAWTNPTTQSTGTLITATIWNTDIVDNLTALRSGSLALTSQATGDVIYASSSTQLGRVAIGTTGYVLTSNGSTPAWSNTPTLTGTNFTGIPISTGISGLGTGVATFLATPSSANLASAVTDETGSGALVFATSPTLVTPTLGVASATSLTLAGALSGVTTLAASGVVTLSDTTDASSSTTGALKVAGGLGVAKKLYVGTELNVTGNVGIGVTPSAWGGYKAMHVGLNSSLAGSESLAITIYSSNAYFTGSAWNYISTDAASQYQQNTGAHVWRTAPSGTAGNALTWTDRMRITSGGDVAIGATAKLYLDGTAGTGNTYIVEGSADRIDFIAGGTNAVQIGSTGLSSNVDIGIAATKKFYLDGGVDTYISETSANVMRFYTAGNLVMTLGASGEFSMAASSVANSPYNNTSGGSANMIINSDGSLARSTSSIRYKHDITTLDTTDAVSTVMALRPITYRGKTDEDQRRYVGFIAEEVAEIAPLLATYDEGGESGTPNYVTYDRVTAYLVAVVQKQQAEIDALKARIQ